VCHVRTAGRQKHHLQDSSTTADTQHALTSTQGKSAVSGDAPELSAQQLESCQLWKAVQGFFSHVHPPASTPLVTVVPAFMMLVEAAGRGPLKDLPWAVPETAPPVCLKGSVGQAGGQGSERHTGRQSHTHTAQ
jgi:hypothetical protein